VHSYAVRSDRQASSSRTSAYGREVCTRWTSSTRRSADHVIAYLITCMCWHEVHVQSSTRPSRRVAAEPGVQSWMQLLTRCTHYSTAARPVSALPEATLPRPVSVETKLLAYASVALQRCKGKKHNLVGVSAVKGRDRVSSEAPSNPVITSDMTILPHRPFTALKNAAYSIFTLIRRLWLTLQLLHGLSPC
jgi:hypothetical protein